MAKAAKARTTSGPDLKAFFDYINDISTQKGLSKDEVMEVVRGSLVTAYQRKYGQEADLEAILDKDNLEIWVICRRKVAEKVEDPAKEVSLEEAQASKPDIQIGEVLEIKENPFEFSRIGATNVRQVLLQRLKELEREIIYNEFQGKEGELISGSFLRWRDRDVMYIDLGRAEGILPRREQIPTDRFRPGDRVKAVIKTVELRREKSREPGPFITLSRAAPVFVKKLFELEIPEIYDGVVEILGIVRHAGYRTKLLVKSNRSDVDPVGACVGIKGVRIQSIVRELGNERIDIVSWSDRKEDLIANALSPARVSEVRLDPNSGEALVLVPDEFYSQAIGMSGQNVRLASQLTSTRLTVKSLTQFSQEMASPEARAQLEALFRPAPVEPPVELDYTPLYELPGLTPRIIGILEGTGIKSVEELVEIDPEKLEQMPGVGKATARQILKIVADTVEITEEES
ncbi:MAG: transcription termination/antitermination protein NusA [Spirochaetia bacterium]|nr:transcription termination/antitermination protein NusA [Spirochaetia bacterium]